MKDQDSIFFRNFSMLLGFLVLLTIVLAITGYLMHGDILGDKFEAKDRSKITKVIEPIAKNNTGKVIIAKKVNSNKPATAAFGGTLDGKKIYDNVCSACHTSGVAGAPKLVASDWDNRISQGFDGLVKSAIKGKGAMPPKGGLADLNKAQMKAVIKYMTKGFLTIPEENSSETSAPNPSITEAATAVVATKVVDAIAKVEDKLPAAVKNVIASKAADGEKTYKTVCFACHGTGAAGAPKLVAAEWKDRMAQGLDALVQSSINGKGVMPPKGGRTDLSDADIKAAVEFMIKGF